MAIVVAVYTAFLFGQAKGRDFWQSPTLAIHMLLHSIMAGIAVYLLIGVATQSDALWSGFLSLAGIITIVVNLFTIGVELATTHPTQDAKTVVTMITKGRYKTSFWVGVILIGNLLPLALLLGGGMTPAIGAVVAATILIGIYFNNHIWVEAPQRIALS